MNRKLFIPFLLTLLLSSCRTGSSKGLPSKENSISLYTYDGGNDFINISKSDFLEEYLANKKRDYAFSKITLLEGPQNLLENNEYLAYLTEKDLDDASKKSDYYFSNIFALGGLFSDMSIKMKLYSPLQVARPDNIENYLLEDEVTVTKSPYSLSIKSIDNYKDIKILYDDNFLPYSISLIDDTNEKWSANFSYFNKKDITRYVGKVSAIHDMYVSYVREFEQIPYKEMNITVNGDYVHIPTYQEYDPELDVWVSVYGEPFFSKDITLNMTSTIAEGNLKYDAFPFYSTIREISLEGELLSSQIGTGILLDRYLSDLFYQNFFRSPVLNVPYFGQFQTSITDITYSENQTTIEMVNFDRIRFYEITYDLQGYPTYIKAQEHNIMDITATITYS